MVTIKAIAKKEKLDSSETKKRGRGAPKTGFESYKREAKETINAYKLILEQPDISKEELHKTRNKLNALAYRLEKRMLEETKMAKAKQFFLQQLGIKKSAHTKLSAMLFNYKGSVEEFKQGLRSIKF